MDVQKIKQADAQYVAHTYARFDVVADHGKGAHVFDAEGKEYIDLSSGIGVNSLGVADEGWLRAVTGQLSKLSHLSNLYYTEPCTKLAEMLCTRTGMDKVFFCNSGAEANEAAIKAARKYSSDKYGAGRHTIISLQNSFHGRTMATLSATGQDVFHQHFNPFLEGFVFVPAGDLPALEKAMDQGVCAVMIELIQGEGGVMPLEKTFVEQTAALCKERDILLIVDEVQTGVGRTGKLLCCEHYHLHPDIVTLAKGLGGGLPIGAALFAGTCSSAFGPGDHGSTFGGNPAVCAGAVEILSRLDDAMLEEVTKKGAFLREKLCACQNVEGVDGIGLMLGIRLREGIASRAVVEKLLGMGVIALTAKAKVRLLPPLVITWEDCEKAASVLAQCIDSF